MTISLVEELERNSVSCRAGAYCGTTAAPNGPYGASLGGEEWAVASGGMLMSWVDEWWKGTGWPPPDVPVYECPDPYPG